MRCVLKEVMVFSVVEGESKNGYFSNIILLDMTTKSKFEHFTKDAKEGAQFALVEGKTVDISASLEQNKFGIRLTNIESILES